MNTVTKKIALSLLASGFLASSLAWAGEREHSGGEHRRGAEHCSRKEAHEGEHKERKGEHRKKHRKEHRKERKHGMQEMRKLLQADIRTNQVEVLAELSGKSTEEIRGQLENRSLGAVMEEHGLSREQVRPLLHARMITTVHEAVKAKRITQREANRMYARMGVMSKECKGGEHSEHSREHSES